ncbi:hypothetical protein GW7_11892 [Heterocephalus glaber]|uniref:Zinc finger protein 771 n=1 Tax=Heterocephalus glaber TaxID=10181 RepID=G5BYL7_HETGA|nr:hypothetical protein GW7_11892 [Heterocephalus glaber]
MPGEQQAEEEEEEEEEEEMQEEMVLLVKGEEEEGEQKYEVVKLKIPVDTKETTTEASSLSSCFCPPPFMGPQLSEEAF